MDEFNDEYGLIRERIRSRMEFELLSKMKEDIDIKAKRSYVYTELAKPKWAWVRDFCPETYVPVSHVVVCTVKKFLMSPIMLPFAQGTLWNINDDEMENIYVFDEFDECHQEFLDWIIGFSTIGDDIFRLFNRVYKELNNEIEYRESNSIFGNQNQAKKLKGLIEIRECFKDVRMKYHLAAPLKRDVHATDKIMENSIENYFLVRNNLIRLSKKSFKVFYSKKDRLNWITTIENSPQGSVSLQTIIKEVSLCLNRFRAFVTYSLSKKL